MLTGYFFCSRHIDRDDLLDRENDAAGPIFGNEKCSSELCSVNAVYTIDDMEKGRIRKDIPKEERLSYQKKWIRELPVKRPALQAAALGKLPDRERRERVTKYYAKMESYLTAVQKELHIKRQAERAEDMQRRLHRIRHGGISDSRSTSERGDETTVEANLPVEMQLMRLARRDTNEQAKEKPKKPPASSSSSSVTDSSLMKVRKKEKNAGRTPKTTPKAPTSKAVTKTQDSVKSVDKDAQRRNHKAK